MGGAAEFERDPAITMLWRVGRSVGRTIYAQVGERPEKGDTLIGMMDTRELARRVVEAHNFLRQSEAGLARMEAEERRIFGEPDAAAAKEARELVDSVRPMGEIG